VGAKIVQNTIMSLVEDPLLTVAFPIALIFPDATARRFWTDQKINYTVAVRSKRTLKENSGSSSKKKAEDLPQVCYVHFIIVSSLDGKAIHIWLIS